MRPLPVPDDLVVACNAEEHLPAVSWGKVVMRAPCDWSKAQDGECQDVEVLVARRGNVPVRFVARIQITLDDLESMRRTGFFWLSLSGNGMQPFSVWAEDLEDDHPRGNALEAIEQACSALTDVLVERTTPDELVTRLASILAPWCADPAPSLVDADERPDDQKWDHQ